jgi:hypothetical protein
VLLPASAVNYEAWFGHEYHISTVSNLPYVIHLHSTRWGRRGRDRMVVGFIAPVRSVPITTTIVSSNPVHGEVYSIQHYVIKFVSDLQEVDGFLHVIWFPQPIKPTARI